MFNVKVIRFNKVFIEVHQIVGTAAYFRFSTTAVDFLKHMKGKSNLLTLLWAQLILLI